mgnify:CR=1 FL=1
MFFKKDNGFKDINPYEVEIGFDGKPIKQQQKQETVIRLPESVHEPFEQRETRFNVNRGLGLHGSCNVRGIPRGRQK